MLYPTTDDLLVSQFTVAQCVADTPLPDKARLIGSFEVLLVSDTVPVARPVTDGSKLSASVTFWPEFNVIPCPMPLVVKPAPETEFCCKVRGPEPELAKVIPTVMEFPTATSPKSALEPYMVRMAG